MEERIKLTKKEAIKLFREHWTWLAETGGNEDSKAQWLIDNDYLNIECNCFLCEYVKQKHNNNCDKCPIDWKSNRSTSIICFYNYFEEWEEAKTVKDRKYFAKLISQLPEK